MSYHHGNLTGIGGGIGGENKAAKAYRQGYLDASSLHIAHPLANGLSPRYPLSAIPPFLQDFAAEYPYITLASIGAVSTLTLLGSGYAATRLAKWCPLTSRLFGEVVEKRAAAGVAVGPVVWGKRMDDLERRMISQLQAANRERRSELDMFQRDVMNRLDTVASMGMTATASSTSEEYQSIDQRLNALADQIESASQDRRTGLEAFKTEVVRLLSAIEAQTSALEANNLEPLEIVADIRQMVSGVLHKVLSNYDFERKTSRKGDNGPIHTNTPKDVQVKAEEDEWALEPGRESFYEELRPGRHWDYAAMDAVAGQPAGIPAEQVAEQLEDAAAMMRERQCGSSRARDNTSHTASFGKTTTSFGAQREDAFPASVDASGMVGALDTVAQSFKDEATTRSTSRPESAPTSEPNNHDDQPTVANPDRIEIDDSGYWSFAIDMEPEQETKGAGWHSATLIYNNSDAIDRLGQNDILP